MLPLEKRLARQARVLPLDDFPGQRQQNKGKMLPLSHFSRQREQWAEGAGWSRGKGKGKGKGKRNSKGKSKSRQVLPLDDYPGQRQQNKGKMLPLSHFSRQREQWAGAVGSVQEQRAAALPRKDLVREGRLRIFTSTLI